MARANVALIFGISGQDGTFLSQFLLDKGYEVHGTSRDKELAGFANLKALGIYPRVALHSTAMNDFRSVVQTISDVNPTEIYNLAAQSSVGLSFEQPVETIDSALGGTLNILEAVRFMRRPIKLYFASSSECFGNTALHPADETTSFQPSSPYGVAKAAAHWLVANYRESYDVFACSGILFNHESPLRPARFVTQKVIRGAVDIVKGKASQLELGNLDVTRDWGWAPEYIEAMWLMLQQDVPGDYVIATGQSHKLQEFVASAFEGVGLDWRQHIVVRKDLLRPTDLLVSAGNPQRANSVLGWRAQTAMHGVVEKLLQAELVRRAAEA
jgi:GDPmannose 4,6-dehydratase